MEAVSLTTATEYERRTELEWRLLRLIPKVPRRNPIHPRRLLMAHPASTRHLVPVRWLPRRGPRTLLSTAQGRTVGSCAGDRRV